MDEAARGRQTAELQRNIASGTCLSKPSRTIALPDVACCYRSYVNHHAEAQGRERRLPGEDNVAAMAAALIIFSPCATLSHLGTVVRFQPSRFARSSARG